MHLIHFGLLKSADILVQTLAYPLAPFHLLNMLELNIHVPTCFQNHSLLHVERMPCACPNICLLLGKTSVLPSGKEKLQIMKPSFLLQSSMFLSQILAMTKHVPCVFGEVQLPLGSFFPWKPSYTFGLCMFSQM